MRTIKKKIAVVKKFESKKITIAVRYSTMNLEEQVRLHKEISLKIEELEEQKKALGQEILQAMTGKAMQFGSYHLKRFSRVTIYSTIEQARQYQAIKLEEVIDKDKLKELYKSGVPVPGIKETDFIQISIKQ